jgi:putative hydrolase of the HAD superfamily
MQKAAAVDWDSIDTVFLDMDGTLLDLRFDNWFWLSLIPARYAAANDMSESQAQQVLEPMFRDVAHTLPWYCIDHWTRQLRLDIRALTRAHLDQVVFLPGAQDFLERLAERDKRVVLVTNSHPELLAMKDERVAIVRHFDACYSTHDFNAPKEDAQFWPRLRAEEKFDPDRTLFVDDNLPVLHSAQAFGIRHIRAVSCPESDKPRRATAHFAAVEAVAELLR